METVLSGTFCYWMTYWLFSTIIPADPRSRNIKPSHNVERIVARNMMILFAIAPVIWYTIPDISDYFTDNYITRFMFSIIVTDAWFYFSHRVLHMPQFYKWHKQHHQFYIPYPLVALYAHPIEVIFCDAISVGLAPAMIRMSTYEFQIWMIFMALHSLLLHSKYKYGNEHTYHHGKILKNYGLFFIVDRILGSYHDELKLQQEINTQENLEQNHI